MGLHSSRVCLRFPPVRALQLQVHLCGGRHVGYCALNQAHTTQPFMGTDCRRLYTYLRPCSEGLPSILSDIGSSACHFAAVFHHAGSSRTVKECAIAGAQGGLASSGREPPPSPSTKRLRAAASTQKSGDWGPILVASSSSTALTSDAANHNSLSKVV